MKIYIAKYDKSRTGGGWSFMRNFARGLNDKLTENYDEADVYFVTGPTIIERDEFDKAKADNKKIVFRIDNAVRNSRNRNTGMSRMKDFAEQADLIIFQSEWARNYLNDFLKLYNNARVIHNGVDLQKFREGMPVSKEIYLYSRFNRDETKNWEVARYYFSRESAKPEHFEKPFLYIIGQFSDELRQYNFDFYNDEQYKYLGVLDEDALAELYRQCKYLIYTYFNDACSNTLIEALASGLTIVGDSYYRQGSANEIIEKFRTYGRGWLGIERMTEQYLYEIEKIL